MIRPSGGLLAAVVALAGCGVGGPESSTGDDVTGAQPHILLLTADTLRADHLSGDGYPRPTSPNLDAFFDGAWVFEQAATVIPKTVPSFATAFTGRHPRVHQVAANFDAIPEVLPTLAELLQGGGYTTAAFLGNRAIRSTKGFDRGFDHFVHAGGRSRSNLDEVSGSFLRWAREHTAAGGWERPTFVWVHYMDPHGPYRPNPSCAGDFQQDELTQEDEERVSAEPAVPAPENFPNKILNAIPPYQLLGPKEDPETRRAIYVARYDEEIRCMDQAAEEILGWFEDRGLLNDAAVIFTSDHGEGLGEHGLYFEHGWKIHEASTRIPLAIKLPGQEKGGRLQAPVSNLDMLPTVLSLAGLKVPADAEGLNLSHTEGLAARLEARPPVVMENSDYYPQKFLGFRGLDDQGRRIKYILEIYQGEEQLYDLESDPLEERNLAAEQPERAAALQRRLRRTLAEYRDQAVEPNRGEEDDEETLRQLRALGYTQ